MSQRELLGRLARTLEDAGIDYMVTGAIASSLQGAPRTTHDIDVVVTMKTDDADTLINAFPPPDYYLDKGSIIEAIKRKSSFNLVEVNTGFKVDFWLLTDDPFDQSRFSRKSTEELEELRVYVSTPEDTILMKLKWARMMGGSKKQFTDALRVYELQHGVLDTDYLERWAGELGVKMLLERIREESSVV
ncbi:MAG: hypothetical protein KKB90_09425 [Actinobacteria bacterium]|nr:hypothetical protein [Actinomycetota bacterium]MBU4219162.1 hypothetical protein [Actinomycetota bacterium]MBU4357650.1 hypothetical protein [Actinomycetota bacterium]MCG2818059.1 hypothetical protein [Actinomycetes bacterium]